MRSIINLTHAKLQGVIYGLCQDNDLAADIVQQVYINVWENIDEIDNDEKIFPLLKHYSRNIFLNELKRSKIRRKTYDALTTTELEISAEEYFLNKEQHNQIQRAINKLPLQQRQIFRMRKEQSLTYKQIAEQLNISTGTIETQMNRALKFLRNELGEMNSEQYSITLLLMYWGMSQL